MSFHLTSLSPGLRTVKVHRGVLGFVFTESPDLAPHSNPVTALEKEGHMQSTGDRDARSGMCTV